MSDPKQPQPDDLDAVQPAFEAVERQVAARSAVSALVSLVRSGGHSLRSALTPVANNLQFALEEEGLSAEGRSALRDAYTALGHALDHLDAMVAAAHARQPTFLLSEALPAALWGPVPNGRVAGASEYLVAAAETLANALGTEVQRTVRFEGHAVVLELVGTVRPDPSGFATNLTRRLVNPLGGELQLREASARIRLPVHTPSAVPANAAKRILLIVDDEPDLAPMFRRFLRKSFDEIHDALDATQAEHLLEKPVTHLVVDAALPEASGVELVARWRQLAPTVRFAAMFSGSTDLRGASIPGVDEVYVKPDGFEALLAELKKR